MGPLTLAIVLVLLFLNFRRATEIFLIMGTVPFAMAGGVVLIYFLDFDLSVAVGVGFIALAGVAVELGVVLLTYINLAMNRQQEFVNREGRSLVRSDVAAAIREGATARIRPIIMTTMTIVLGLLPIMIDTGSGSEVMKRIAAPMFGGMISAMVMTLVVLPALYYVVKSWKLKKTAT